MRRAAGHLHLEDRDALAGGHDAAAVAGRLRDEHVAVGPRGRLDGRPRRRAPDLLLRDEEEGDGERGLASGPHEVPVRVPGKTGPRPSCRRCPARRPGPLPGERSGPRRWCRSGCTVSRWLRTRMPGPSPPHSLRAARRSPYPSRPRGALDAGGEGPHDGLDVVHHPVDRVRVVRRRLDPHPLEDRREDLVRIDARFVPARTGGAVGAGGSLHGFHLQKPAWPHASLSIRFGSARRLLGRGPGPGPREANPGSAPAATRRAEAAAQATARRNAALKSIRATSSRNAA